MLLLCCSLTVAWSQESVDTGRYNVLLINFNIIDTSGNPVDSVIMMTSCEQRGEVSTLKCLSGLCYGMYSLGTEWIVDFESLGYKAKLIVINTEGTQEGMYVIDEINIVLKENNKGSVEGVAPSGFVYLDPLNNWFEATKERIDFRVWDSQCVDTLIMYNDAGAYDYIVPLSKEECEKKMNTILSE